ncbi:MAG: beta-ketoacyl-ACP synthase III [Vampirovibrionales bacterium]
MTAYQSLYGVKMVGIGSFVPPTVLTNEDMSKLVETSDEWIASRTGIRERRVVSGDESVASMAIAAAKDALASAGLEDGRDIDLILVATSTSDTIYPAVACQVQHAIGATKAAGYDMALACSGFVFGCVTAEQFLRTGMVKKALVIGSDIHTRVVDWSDRNTCVLFGDGAGAAILEATTDGSNAFLASTLQTDGTKGHELTLNTSWPNCPLVQPRSEQSPYVYMNGREIFKFVVNVVPTTIQASVAKAGLTLNEIDYLVLHQANTRLMTAMAERMGIDEAKLITHLEGIGNTSAASVPIALNHAVRTGVVRPGQKLVLCGFGAGLAWGSTVVEWTLVDQREPWPSTAQKSAAYLRENGVALTSV